VDAVVFALLVIRVEGIHLETVMVGFFFLSYELIEDGEVVVALIVAVVVAEFPQEAETAFLCLVAVTEERPER